MAFTTPLLNPNVLPLTVATAHAAGEVLLQGWGQRPATQTKSAPTDLVTEYDKRAEEVVMKRLAADFPEHAIVGEEGSRIGPSHAKCVWYVDPLDGTMNFAHGLPFFAVSIGLVVNDAPVVGVVHAPALGWTFAGMVGGGATRNGMPIAVSHTAALPHGLFATGFPYVAGQPNANMPEFAAFIHTTHGVRRVGSAALDLAFVAAGWIEGYWEAHIQSWDIAAGAALVVAAGGRVSDVDGGTFDARTGRVLATNGLVHEQALNLLKTVATAKQPL
ncbi:MAG: inositol monophosphatase family protein [Deltaproteobacteria bacterium]|nr:inositol monophosphatase family protein [Deltaproteobacteria bacterium]